MLVSESGIVMLLRLVQSQNVLEPMLVSESGIVMLLRLVKLRNVQEPMVLTPSSITISEHPLIYHGVYL